MQIRHGFSLVFVLALGALSVLHAAVDVPFRAVIETQPVVSGSCGPGCLLLEIPGAGTATHMGAVTIDGPSEVDVVAGRQTATSTLTAANGDQLTLAIDGTVQFTGPGPTDPVTFTGSWEVVSGTGRFDGATGGGTYVGVSEIPVGGSFTLTGSISRPGGR